MDSYISNDHVIQLFRIASHQETNQRDAKIIYNKIITSLSFLVLNCTKQYKKYQNYPDLVQDGFIGLIKAVNTFDANKFPNFFVYAVQWITNEIIRSIKKNSVVRGPKKQEILYFADIEDMPINQTDEVTPLDKICDHESFFGVNKAVALLGQQERRILGVLFSEQELTLRDASKQCGISHERIRQIKNRAILRLRENKRLLEITVGV